MQYFFDHLMRKHSQIIKEQHNGFTHTFFWIDHLDVARFPDRVFHSQKVCMEADPEFFTAKGNIYSGFPFNS